MRLRRPDAILVIKIRGRKSNEINLATEHKRSMWMVSSQSVQQWIVKLLAVETTFGLLEYVS